MTQVKICGLMTLSDVAAVNTTTADFAGFVFAPSRHQIDIPTATLLKKHLNPQIKTVGVFVHESYETITKIYQAGLIDLVQLHQNYESNLNQRLHKDGLPIIQVFQNQSPKNQVQADYIMVDSGQGSGQTLTWQPLPTITKPLILAGGLTPENVAQAISVVQPTIVDVSSGVEVAHHKSIAKIQQFVNNAKGA